MHSINLYVTKYDAEGTYDFPHVVIDDKYCLVTVTDELVKAAGADHMDDCYTGVVETYLLHKVTLDETMVYVETEYFGGVGGQRAKSWLHGIKEKHKEKHDTINSALERIGVVNKKDMDGFDTVGLGGYRENEDVLDEYRDIHGKTVEYMMRRVLLRRIPKEIYMTFVEERAYTSENEYFVRVAMMIPNAKWNYYKAVVESDVQSAPVYNIRTFKETRARATEDEFISALTTSFVRLEYVDDGPYRFIKARAIPELDGTQVTEVCMADCECNDIGSISIHDQVKDQILMYDNEFAFDPYRLGLNGREETKKGKMPKLVKKTIEVYECPDCENGELDPVGLENPSVILYQCNKCPYKVKMDVKK